jgi:hypothetical protein
MEGYMRRSRRNPSDDQLSKVRAMLDDTFVEIENLILETKEEAAKKLGESTEIDLVAQASGDLYDQTFLKEMFEHAKSRFPDSQLLSRNQNGALGFCLILGIDTEIVRYFNTLKRECEATTRAVSEIDVQFLEFAIYVRNLAATRPWSLFIPEIGKTYSTTQVDSINGFNPSRVKEVLCPGIENNVQIKPLVRM